MHAGRSVLAVTPPRGVALRLTADRAGAGGGTEGAHISNCDLVVLDSVEHLRLERAHDPHDEVTRQRPAGGAAGGRAQLLCGHEGRRLDDGLREVQREGAARVHLDLAHGIHQVGHVGGAEPLRVWLDDRQHHLRERPADQDTTSGSSVRRTAGPRLPFPRRRHLSATAD